MRSDENFVCVNWATIPAALIPSTTRIHSALRRIPDKSKPVLDVGCGLGRSMIRLWELGFTNIIGLDVNAEAVEAARRACDTNGFAPRLLVASAESTTMDSHSMSFVLMQGVLTVLHPSTERAATLKEMRRVLAPNGLLLISDFSQAWHNEIYRRRYEDGEQQFRDTGTFSARVAGRPEFEYLAHHFSERELTSLIRDCGFQIVQFRYRKQTTQSGNLLYGFEIVATPVFESK